MNELPEGMKALRDVMADAVCAAIESRSTWRPAGYIVDALLAPDGPLWPLLRMTGLNATTLQGREEALVWLADWGITGPLADACLAAAEVQP